MTKEFLRRSSRGVPEHRSWSLQWVPGADLRPLPLELAQ